MQAGAGPGLEQLKRTFEVHTVLERCSPIHPRHVARDIAFGVQFPWEMEIGLHDFFPLITLAPLK